MSPVPADTATPTALHIVRLEAFVFRHALATPVRTSFGVMHERPALLLRAQDDSGAHGWGEVWCNFPACGAEHRSRLVETVLAPLLLGRMFESPPAAFEHLSAATAVLALQSGEPGPIAQAIAGIDLALWDLLARRAGQPLWRFLGGRSDAVDVYASGINPDAPQDTVAAMREAGHTSFKIKVGFGEQRDLANLRAVRGSMRPGESCMVDANQAWALPAARTMAALLAEFELAWLEEPLRADRPWHEWQTLRNTSTVPLASGENLIGAAAFDALVQSAAVQVVQPDVAKWGGLSGCLSVVDRVREAGLRYCPHYLGGGIGLLHSAHLLAAAGGTGRLEVDANPNPLRSLLCGRVNQVHEGRVRLGDEPGIGVEPDLAELRRGTVG